jgi:general secretion pathway protein H
MMAKGFTLIELLVVLVIIGLMLSLAPVAFRQALPGVQHKAVARDLAAALRGARGRAIQENRDVAVIVDVEARTFATGDGGELGRLGDDLTVSLVVGQSEQLDETRGRIRFFPDGTATGGRITLTGNQRDYHVLVDWLSGRVAIRE